MAAAAPAPRKSAEERREELVTVALRHFAEGGYQGTSTEAIAREAGISQPYLFRLFRTKKELFLACEDRHHEFLADVFARAAQGVPREQRLERMGRAYGEQLLPDRHALLFQMQSYAACSDPEIREHVRARYAGLVREVARIADVGVPEVWSFFATGMLLNVIASLDLPGATGEQDWERAWAALERT